MTNNSYLMRIISRSGHRQARSSVDWSLVARLRRLCHVHHHLFNSDAPVPRKNRRRRVFDCSEQRQGLSAQHQRLFCLFFSTKSVSLWLQKSTRFNSGTKPIAARRTLYTLTPLYLNLFRPLHLCNWSAKPLHLSPVQAKRQLVSNYRPTV